MANDVEHAPAPPAAGTAGGRPVPGSDLAERSRERILRAALEEFAAKGFDGTTTASIARHAKVTQPLVHYHFTSKITLWKATVRAAVQASAHAFAGVEQEIDGLGPLDQMKVIARRYIRASAMHPELARIVSYESMQGGERLQWLNDEALGVRFDWFGQLYEEGVAAGWMKPLPVLHVLSSFAASGAYLFMIRASMWETYGIDVSDPAVVEEHADTVIEMFFHGLVQEVRP